MDNKVVLFGGIGLVVIAILVFINSPANVNPKSTVTATTIVPTPLPQPSDNITSTDALQHQMVSVEEELNILSRQINTGVQPNQLAPSFFTS